MKHEITQTLRKKAGKMLATHRKKHKLSMADIGKSLGVARSTIHNVEHGLMASHFEIIVAYARVLGDRAVIDLNKLIASFRLYDE